MKTFSIDNNGYPRWDDSGQLCHLTNEAKGKEVHHIDGNKMNFLPDNLVRLEKWQHEGIEERIRLLNKKVSDLTFKLERVRESANGT